MIVGRYQTYLTNNNSVKYGFVNIEKYVDIRVAKFVDAEHLYLLIHNYKHGYIGGEEEGIIYEKVFP